METTTQSSSSPSKMNPIEQSIKWIYIDTGNLLRSEEVKRHATLLPEEEAIKGLNLSVDYWKNHRGEIQDGQVNEDTISITDNRLIYKVDPDQRENCKITVKLFAYHEDCSILEEAVNFVLKRLDTNYLDSLILALPPTSIKLSVDQIKQIWRYAERIGTTSKVKDFGMSDLDTTQLIELFYSAKAIKPSSNQINLESCCVIPPEMRDFAQNNNIKLLTHNDPRDFMPLEKFERILSSCGVQNVKAWSRNWVARYTIIQKHKGIVQSKGYVLSARRKNETK